MMMVMMVLTSVMHHLSLVIIVVVVIRQLVKHRDLPIQLHINVLIQIRRCFQSLLLLKDKSLLLRHADLF